MLRGFFASSHWKDLGLGLLRKYMCSCLGWGPLSPPPPLVHASLARIGMVDEKGF